MPLATRDIVVAWVNRRDWATRQSIPYKARDFSFIVRRGFITDFASVPRLLLSLFPATGTWTLAAIIHDWLLKLLKTRKPLVNSNDADGMLRRIAGEEGTDFVDRWAIWTGVRWAALFSQGGYRRQGWFLWGNLWRVFVWSIILFPAILFAILGVGLAFFWLGLLKLIFWALHCK